MNVKTIAITLALLFGRACCAMAQSSCTTGSAENRADTGYSTPYGEAGLYA
jgi:hypothetical protein